eukprot:CAMPEP_0172504744 /NCGR_PEP_ID=MMETSP1066-20121228/180971_1 /TAXON_ID=671091 /ORGANISM="Coscinodiscus wailesii, Strain CCMP2513" /LENGTH=109 /DNA_ID=CAMNT_0013281043 /DNA_START=204 /DNA_END=536 /DNA_ORIENTATION=+
MWTGEETGVVTVSETEDGFGECCGGAFSFGSGDVYDFGQGVVVVVMGRDGVVVIVVVGGEEVKVGEVPSHFVYRVFTFGGAGEDSGGCLGDVVGGEEEGDGFGIGLGGG